MASEETGFVDAHQHYWSLSRGDYGWLTPALEPIYRDFQPSDLAPLRQAAGISRTVLVQAAPTIAETRYMLELADREPSVGAVVGWIDPLAPDALSSMEELARHPRMRGVRPMLQDIADTFYILAPEALATLEKLPPLGLTFDALVQPRHLPVIAALADRLPDLSIVVDHAAKPAIAGGRMDPWSSDLAALAMRPNVSIKLSGLVTEAGVEWTVETLRPYVRRLFDSFGPHRVMFGSDWPVLNLAATYARWWAAARELTSQLSHDESDAVFRRNASRFYRL